MNRDLPTPMERAKARELGLNRYFTGRPCVNGHLALRSVDKSECVRCKQEREKRRIAKNPEHHRERIRNRAEINREKTNERCRREYRNNPNAFKERTERWKTKHPEKAKQLVSARVKKWRGKPENKEAVLSFYRNRRARRKKNGGNHSGEDVISIFKLQRGKCAYCRVRLNKKRHVDHVIPLASGGSNDRTNLQILCAQCNLKKGAKDPIAFMQANGRLL